MVAELGIKYGLTDCGLGGSNSLASGNCLSTTAFCSGIGLRSLSTNGQASTVPQAPECLNIRKSTDVQLGLSTKVTFNKEASPLDSTSNSSQFFIR
jgi:hypothetical protein